MSTSSQKHAENRKYLRTKRKYNPQNIKTLLQLKGLKRSDLVKATHLNKNTIDNILSGRVASPEWTTMILIAEALDNCSLDQFTSRYIPKYQCSKKEQELIGTVRKYPNFDIDTFITILTDNSLRGKIIRKVMKNTLTLPEDILEDFYKLITDIIKNLKEGSPHETINNSNSD